MDLTSATTAGLSLYQAGGLALVLLAIGVAGSYLMFKFLIAMINDLRKLVEKMAGEDRDKMLKCIDNNTASNCAVVNSSENVVDEVKTLAKVMTERLPAGKVTFRTPLPGEAH